MNLKSISTNELFSEMAERLKDIYQRESGGKEFRFGCFSFTFHEGRFQGVELQLRNKLAWGFKQDGAKLALVNQMQKGGADA